jgi:hypothetical protein
VGEGGCFPAQVGSELGQVRVGDIDCPAYAVIEAVVRIELEPELNAKPFDALATKRDAGLDSLENRLVIRTSRDVLKPIA